MRILQHGLSGLRAVLPQRTWAATRLARVGLRVPASLAGWNPRSRSGDRDVGVHRRLVVACNEKVPPVGLGQVWVDVNERNLRLRHAWAARRLRMTLLLRTCFRLVIRACVDSPASLVSYRTVETGTPWLGKMCACCRDEGNPRCTRVSNRPHSAACATLCPCEYSARDTI